MITGLVGISLMVVMMGGMLLGGKWMGHKAGRHGQHEPKAAVCPVSGNRVAISSAAVQAMVGGTLYYFDDETHLRQFVLDPEKYLSGAATSVDGSQPIN